MKNYKARWTPTGAVMATADVDFKAQSDYHARLIADKLARELSVTRTPRTITSAGKLIECIQIGTST